MNNRYDSYSHSIRYGLFATLPLFLHSVITETDLILSGSQLKMILTAELILQKIATLFGLLSPFSAIIIWAAVLFLIFLKEKDETGPLNFEFSDFKRTMIESLLPAAILWFTAFGIFLLQTLPPINYQELFHFLPQLLAIKSGAAFFEEFLCRMILLGGSLWILQKYKVSYFISCVIALLFSSLIFAEMHYFHFVPWLGEVFGVMSDPNNPYTPAGFIYRFFAGMFLGYIYLKKGFATCTWAHALSGYFQLFLI